MGNTNLLLYSLLQNAFHIEEETDYKSKTPERLERRVFTDYVPIYRGAYSECRRVSEVLMDVRDKEGQEVLLKALKLTDTSPLTEKVSRLRKQVRGMFKNVKKEAA